MCKLWIVVRSEWAGREGGAWLYVFPSFRWNTIETPFIFTLSSLTRLHVPSHSIPRRVLHNFSWVQPFLDLEEYGMFHQLPLLYTGASSSGTSLYRLPLYIPVPSSRIIITASAMNFDLVLRRYHKRSNFDVYIYSWNWSSETSTPGGRWPRVERVSWSSLNSSDTESPSLPAASKTYSHVWWWVRGEYVLRMPLSIVGETTPDYVSRTNFCSSTGQSKLYISELSIHHGTTGILRQTQSRKNIN